MRLVFETSVPAGAPTCKSAGGGYYCEHLVFDRGWFCAANRVLDAKAEPMPVTHDGNLLPKRTDGCLGAEHKANEMLVE